jgi:microcystin-dependent protein
MSNPFVGEIRMFGGNFAPAGWAFCDGSLIPISENATLFNLIGTTYGGDGQQTFALPNLLGRIPIHAGQGSGTQNYVLGQIGGVETVTLSNSQIPTHTHTLVASTDPANASGPQGNVLANTVNTTPYFAGSGSVPLNSGSLTSVGGSQPHDNLMPFLCVNFIISLFGIFPSQS